MSAQSYTNKRRILAEASVTKTMYPQRVTYNNPILATRGCTPNFNNISYTTICACPFNGRIGRYPTK